MTDVLIELFACFARPFWLLALLVLIPLLALRVWAHTSSQRKLDGMVAPRLYTKLVRNTSQFRHWMSFSCLALGLAMLILALARPQWGVEKLPSFAEGRSLIIAIDTSRSMLATDISPNRLERTKYAAREVVDNLEEDRIGIIAFAGKSFIQAPLTNDREAILESIEQLDTEIIPRGGTNLTSPIRMALQAFDEEDAKQNALVIFSDGEALEGQDELNHLKQAAKDENMAIITIGVGTLGGSVIPENDSEGRPIPGAFIKDETGTVVRSRLDSTALRALTNDSGFYIQLGGKSSLTRIVETIKQNLQVTRKEQEQEERPIERFLWPLSFAILFMALSHVVHLLFMPRRLKNKSTQSLSKVSPKATVIIIGSLFLFDFASSLDRSAWTYLEREDYSIAEDKLLASLENGKLSLKESTYVHLALGTKYYRTGDFENASKSYGNALIFPDVKTREHAHYNLGNTLVRRGEIILNPKRNDPDAIQQMAYDKEQAAATLLQWIGAIEHYQAALKLNNKNVNARHNIEILEERIRQLKDHEPPPTPEEDEHQQPRQKDTEDKDSKPEPQDKNQQKQPPPEDDNSEENPPTENSPENESNSNDPNNQPDQPNDDNQESESDTGSGEGELTADNSSQQQPQKQTQKSDLKKNKQTGYSPSEARQLIDALADENGELRPVFPKGYEAEKYKNW